jgi:tetratricopeptide (TPR) repeat protein
MYVVACLLLAALAGAVSCKPKTPAAKAPLKEAAVMARSTEPRKPDTEEIGWLTVRVEDPLPESLLAIKPPDLPARVRNFYRLRPDRRFLYAAAELPPLTKGVARRGVLTLRFEGERWHLSMDGAPLGDLSELPDFAEAKAFLLSRLTGQPALGKSPGATSLGAAEREGLEQTLRWDPLQALVRLNPGWAASPGDPALAAVGLRSLLWLSLQTCDELQLSDPILGKAMALFAIVEAAEPGRHTREECLLASLLGYEDHAKLMAKNLATDDPVRLFADWDVAGLKTLAHLPKAKPDDEYFYLLRLARSKPDEGAWVQEFNASSWGRRLDAASARLPLELDNLSWKASPAELLEFHVLTDLSLLPNAEEADHRQKGDSWLDIVHNFLESIGAFKRFGPESRLPEIEQAIAKRSALLGGPLLDEYSVRAYYLAVFYSSLYTVASFQTEFLGSVEGALRFGHAIVSPPAGTATELKTWILHRAPFHSEATTISADLASLRHIGTAPLSLMAHSLSKAAPDLTSAILRVGARSFFERLDSRPSNLHYALRAASELLKDLGTMEQCMRVAAKESPRELGQDLPWALRFVGDRSALSALAKHTGWPVAVRAAALYELFELKAIDSTALASGARELMREDPAHSDTLLSAVQVLEREEKRAAALDLIDEWLQRHPSETLERASLSSTKSRLLRQQNKPQEAWPIAQAAAETWKEDCLWEATLTLLDLGRLKEAEDYAKRTLGRYPDDRSKLALAQVLWVEGKDAEAAELLLSAPNDITPRSWSWYMPAAFAGAFKKRDEARAEAAFAKLALPSVPTGNLCWFLDGLTREGRPELAARLSAHLRRPQPQGWVVTSAYRARVKSEGQAAAGAWLVANATPAEIDIVMKGAVQNGDFDLPWSISDPADPGQKQVLYVIRAVSLLHQPDAAQERRDRVIKFFEGQRKGGFTYLALFILGRIDRATLFAGIQHLDDVCDVSWVLGIASAHEGRYDEANGWFQVCMEPDITTPPRSWTAGILDRWNQERCNLAQISAKRIF